MNRQTTAWRFVLWTAAGLWLALVAFLSLQSGEGTAQTSGVLAIFLHRCLACIGISVDLQEMHSVLRLMAHVLVFVPLGALVTAACMVSTEREKRRCAGLGSCAGCVLIAVLVEVAKVWIPGRHLQWHEVLLNVAGVLVGIGAGFGVLSGVRWLERNKRNRIRRY